jgi:hypothetical protein
MNKNRDKQIIVSKDWMPRQVLDGWQRPSLPRDCATVENGGAKQKLKES